MPTTTTKPYFADWRSPGNYPSIWSATKEQWAWEFLRRCREYSKDFKNAEKLRLTTVSKGRSLQDLPPFLPRDLADRASLAPWICYPPAVPRRRQLGEYVIDLGQVPDFGIRRDVFISQQWGLSSPISPETGFDADKIKFSLREHHPARLQLEHFNEPRQLVVTLMRDEVAVVIDTTDDLDEQFDQIRQTIWNRRQDPKIDQRLHGRRKQIKTKPSPIWLWLMLRLADAVRAHQIKCDWTPDGIADDFGHGDVEFSYQDFIVHLQAEVLRTSAYDQSTRDGIWKSVNKTQLTKWRKDHLVRMICRRGYLSLISG